jgi:hemerythrin-like metal-binding protein
MEQWSQKWSDDFACGDKGIDSAHKEIMEKGTLFYEKLCDYDSNEEELIAISNKLMKKIISHMALEINLMQKLGIEGWEEHDKNHNSYCKKFDLKHDYTLSNKMRVLMFADMVKDYMSNHFFQIDLPDLNKIKDKLHKK